MNTEIEFANEKKWTIVISHIDSKSMEAWVQNVGMTESQLRKEFKMTESNGFEKDMSCNELKTMLNYVVTNCIIEAVLEIENRFNTDQKTINEVKRNIESRLKAKGYIIVEHCFSSGEIDVEPGSIYETRAYLKLLNDRCKEREIELSKAKATKHSLDNDIATLTHDKEVMQKEFDELCKRYKNGKSFLKDVDDDVAKYKDKLYLLDEEKNSLFIEVEEKKNEFKKLEIDIEKLQKDYDKQTRNIDCTSSQIKKKETELNDLNTKIEIATTKYNELISSLEKYIRLSREL